MEDIIKIVKLLEESELQMKNIGDTIENEENRQKGEILIMLLGELGVCLSENQ